MTAAAARLRPAAAPGFVAEVARRFVANDLLTVASAMAFQLLTALIPFVLFAVALLGLFDLEGVYETDLLPLVAERVSPAALSLLDDTVRRVLDERNLFWLTAGAVVAVHQFSGAIRAAMNGLSRAHEVEDDRPWLRRMAVSVWLALAVGALIIGSVALVRVVPLLLGDLGPVASAISGIVRWGLAGAALLLAMGLVVHHGADRDRPKRWVTLGAGLASVCWLGSSALFVLYLVEVASYGSVFGSLATVVVLCAYLYLSATAFLVGVQADAVLDERRRS